MVVRTYEDELEYLERINDHCWRIKKGFQPNMKVEVWSCHFSLQKQEELHHLSPGQVLCELPAREADAGGTEELLQTWTGAWSWLLH